MRKAFTLTEILIVLACFVVVTWLLLPAVGAITGMVKDLIVRDSRDRAQREIERRFQAEAAKMQLSREATEFVVREKFRVMKEELEQEAARKKLAEAEERGRKEVESAKKWSGYRSKAMMAVIGLFVFLGVARMTPPVSRAIAAAVVKRVAPQPRAIEVPDEDR